MHLSENGLLFENRCPWRKCGGKCGSRGVAVNMYMYMGYISPFSVEGHLGGLDHAVKQICINKLVWFSDVANLKKIEHFDDNSSQLRGDIYKATCRFYLAESQAGRRGPWTSY